MKIKLAAAWLAVVGVVLAAFLLIGDRTLSPTQLAQVKAACLQCHTDVPMYDKAITVHDVHSTFTCDRCHSDSGLKTASAIRHFFEWLAIVIGAISLGGAITSFIIADRKTKVTYTGRRTIRRFRSKVIWMHWLHMIAFAILVITGFLIFFHLTNQGSGIQVQLVHRIAAVFFVIIAVIYSILDPRPSLEFLKEAFHWDSDDLAWLKASPGYYFTGRKAMPPQDRINGDQKLWQLVVIITSIILIFTGVVLWFFKFKIPRLVYGGFLIMHSLAFVLVLITFFWHFYLRTLHPDFGESLSSMIDGKVSEYYASEHYSKWYRKKNSQG